MSAKKRPASSLKPADDDADETKPNEKSNLKPAGGGTGKTKPKGQSNLKLDDDAEGKTKTKKTSQPSSASTAVHDSVAATKPKGGKLKKTTAPTDEVDADAKPSEGKIPKRHPLVPIDDQPVLDLMPRALAPDGRLRAGARSYTVPFEDFKVCVNLAKKTFWVYSSLDLPHRNFGWSNSTPADTWQRIKDMLDAAGMK